MTSVTELTARNQSLAQAFVAQAGKILSEDEVRLLQQALRMAQFAHRDERRETGGLFIEHAVAVAQILLEYSLDFEIIVAAVLHDVVEHTEVTLGLIEESFGPGVARLVDGVTKLASLPEKTREEKQAENLRKLILATSSDVRVMLLRLAHRLDNMRSLAKRSPERQELMGRETMEIYAPIAGRLGMSKMEAELEDLAFRALDPQAFEEIEAKLSASRQEQQARLNDIRRRLLAELQKAGVKVDDGCISSRQKHIYGIHSKMHTWKYYGKDVWHIYDRLGVRVIVPTVPDCYLTLGVVHSLWKHVPEEFDDYISSPRPTGYQSLHTAVQYNPENVRDIVEIQIRTPEMHDQAEYGIAAHWRYKEGIRRDVVFDNKVAWLRQLLELGSELTDAQEFVDAMKTDVFADRVYVFTPRDDIVDLPAGSTPIDFAYHIHTDIGHRCRGAKVNGRLVSLNRKLQTGDKVEIITAKRGGPSRDWLNPNLEYVKTRRAISKIRQWFRRQDREQMIAQGRESVDRELRRLSIIAMSHDKVAELFGYKTVEDFLAVVGYGDINNDQIATKLLEAESRQRPEELLVAATTREPLAQPLPAEGINIMGTEGLLVHLARCCNPVPGDPIVGYITRGRGVTVHRSDCANVLNTSEAERLINVSWGQPVEQRYLVPVLITAFNREGLMRDIAAVVADERLGMSNMNASTRNNVITFLVTLEITDLGQLGRVVHKILQVPNVTDVRRRTSA